MSASLSLLSSYYSALRVRLIALHQFADCIGITHETVTIRLFDTAGDEHVQGTHASNLANARGIVFSKLIRVLSSLQKNTEFSKFQVRLGGDFPRHEYEE